MKRTEYGVISRAMVIDALCGADMDVPTPVMAKLIDTQFMTAEYPPGRGGEQPVYAWSRHKLNDLTTDTLVDLYVSLKNTEAPRVLS